MIGNTWNSIILLALWACVHAAYVVDPVPKDTPCSLPSGSPLTQCENEFMSLKCEGGKYGEWIDCSKTPGMTCCKIAAGSYGCHFGNNCVVASPR